METNSENLKMQRYLRSGWVLGFFPLHNREITTELGIEWLRYNAMPWEQPLFAIKVIECTILLISFNNILFNFVGIFW